jgi:hypothetical protein
MNKNIISLLVHDRYSNLEKWLHCWNICEHYDFELVVIHNVNTIGENDYKALCESNDVKYIQRLNVGYDIGIFQDICLERLDGFDNDWQMLLTIPDDFIPMTKNFVKDFVKVLNNDVHLVCTEISDEIKTHIRTVGFLITKEISKQITFDKEIITTKDDCYEFEHRSNNTLYDQIIRLGLNPKMANILENSPLWDINHRAYLNRWDEHNNVFYNTQKIAIICPIYKCYPQIISSMILQTHKDWELYLVHDGEADQFLRDYVALVNDDRIKFVETKERLNKYGHPIRADYLNKLKKSDCSYVLITNGDNYHTPNCLENMIKGFVDENVIATYCDAMVHSYFGHSVLVCQLEYGKIDCACVMIRKDVACNVGWNDVNNAPSDWTYFSDVAKTVGWDKFRKVSGCLLIHN